MSGFFQLNPSFWKGTAVPIFYGPKRPFSLCSCSPIKLPTLPIKSHSPNPPRLSKRPSSALSPPPSSSFAFSLRHHSPLLPRPFFSLPSTLTASFSLPSTLTTSLFSLSSRLALILVHLSTFESKLFRDFGMIVHSFSTSPYLSVKRLELSYNFRSIWGLYVNILCYSCHWSSIFQLANFWIHWWEHSDIFKKCTNDNIMPFVRKRMLFFKPV